MAFTYDDTLSDARSRVRLAVGDTADPGLLPDATYDAQWALSATRRATFAAAAADDTLTVDALPYRDGDAVVLVTLYDDVGPGAGSILYVVGADATAGTFQLAATPGGDALDLTGDGAGVIGRVDEDAATRAIAAALAAKYAQAPSQVRLVSGLSVTWERVQQWNRIARGEAGGASSGVARGVTIRRGPPATLHGER